MLNINSPKKLHKKIFKYS